MERSMLLIASRFYKLLKEIQPKPEEVARGKRNLFTIKSRLSKSFKIARIVWVGSHLKGTAIRSYSDIDIFVVVRREEALWGGDLVKSSTLLGWLKEDLKERYPLTDIRRDGQAIVISFGQGEHCVDLVPALYHSPNKEGFPLYLIPDGSNDWLITSPDAQLKYIKGKNEYTEGRLIKIVQLMKCWAYSRSPKVPMNSLYLETVLASFEMARGSSRLSLILANAFTSIAGRAGRPILDPLAISEPISISKTETQKDLVQKSLDYSVSHALGAIEAEIWGDSIEAIRQWNIVFNGIFPE